MTAQYIPSLPWHSALVIGLGQSGRDVAALLAECGLSVRAYDRNSEAQADPRVKLWLGDQAPPAEAFAGVDLIVLSPGVPPLPIRALARIHSPKAAIHGEMSLALDLFNRHWPGLPTVLITGTNGKSTVTALTGELLAAGGLDPFTGGNLGVPLSSVILGVLSGERAPPKSLVLECSSYQLETMNGATLHPTDVAMVLNITPDHLDRYDDFNAYARTKMRVFAGLKNSGLALLDADDSVSERMRQGLGGRLLLVNGERPGDPVILHEETGDGDGDGIGKFLLLLHLAEDEQWPRNALALAGRHNAKNALFALAAARHLGIDLGACEAGLRAFRGLPHRMIAIRELDGITYYNDSKATNVASVVANLDGFDRPYVLIAGGRRKDDDLTQLRTHLARRARALVAIGESADAFAAIAEGIVPWTKAKNMHQAVAAARKLAHSGDAVLLSPACSSFDWYRNYAERGDVFTREVLALEPTTKA